MDYARIKNRLVNDAKKFLVVFSNYLEEPFYYFGSILRPDYISGSSDIDIAIFTENEDSTISKILAYCKLPKSCVKQVVWILPDSTTTYGYKIQHTMDRENIFEYSIYNTQFKDKILAQYLDKKSLPIYTSICLQIIKIMYYQLHVISGKTYSETKRYLLSYGLGQKDEDKFLVF
jgi:predicted nucleotidyltransferase